MKLKKLHTEDKLRRRTIQFIFLSMLVDPKNVELNYMSLI